MGKANKEPRDSFRRAIGSQRHHTLAENALKKKKKFHLTTASGAHAQQGTDKRWIKKGASSIELSQERRHTNFRKKKSKCLARRGK